MTVAKRSEESLQKAYDKVASVVGLGRGEDPEDVVAQQSRRDPWAWGIFASMRFTGFLKLLNRENAAVDVRQLIFALELTALNWYNAVGMPITPDQIKAARKAAYDHYVANIDK